MTLIALERVTVEYVFESVGVNVVERVCVPASSSVPAAGL